MASPFEGGGSEGTNDREETPPPLMKEQIKGHVFALKSSIKSHNQRNKGDPIRLDFESEDIEVQDLGITKGKELPHDSINEWADLREAFTARYSIRRACFKEPHEITKIIRKSNESLTAFKERWTVETGFIMGVPKVMKIWLFMDSVKSPELAKRFLNKVPTTLNEMMERLDDFIRSEEAYARTELSKGEIGETHRNTSLPFNRRDNWSSRNTHLGESSRNEYRSNYKSGRDAYPANRTRDDRASYPLPRGGYNHQVASVLTLDSLTKHPEEILATETQLRLPAPSPMLNLLRKKLEMALELGKLNHLVKDVQQRGRRPHGREAPQPEKVINLISVNSVKDKKQKGREMTEPWMNIPISFPTISSKYVSDEPLIVKAKVEGYLVRRVYVDEGSPVETSKKETNDQRKFRRGKEVAATEEVLVNPSFPDQREPSDMTGMPRRIIEHTLNVNPSMDPMCQKRRTFSMEKIRIVTNEVAEWVKAEIISPVKYPTYISNPVLVKKGDGTWRMCIDFKNLNSACPKDYYPLPNIDCKVESVMGFRGHIPTVGSLTFQYQIGRNLEAYVDDMVIKSKDEKMLLADIVETFDNLKRINMKLNPKKCSFGVEEGKFLGYMVTSEGIRANPKKTKALADLQSPRTLKEMQSLSGKLAALNRFLAKSAERSLPFFNTLKNITKENKHEYRWTKEAEQDFQQMKKLIIDLPSLTPPWEKETLTLNEDERNYAPMEKLALSLIHMTRRLRRYFEAHPVKVIMDQPIKNILNNTKTSGKLSKYAVELGAYNITFIPRNAVKGQVLVDFLSEVPEGEKEELYFRMPEVPLEKDDTESWTLFTDGASSPKGSGAGLVLIGPSGIEYTYALRLTFPSTNNEANQINGSYEASKDSMIKYLAKEKEYASGFKSF
ncbi:reverse transcriptase domain-containing protein [Tanacetum coccineum]